MSRIGKKIIRGLREFNDSLKRGEDVTKKFTWRRVVLDTQTSPYDGQLVKKTRSLLGASQSVFARFLGVSVKTVRSWEQEQSVPSEMARRFLDEIRANPTYWTERLRGMARSLSS